MAATFAHEISQRLTAIRLNLEAADLLIAANRATTDALRDLLRDVRKDEARVGQIVERHRSMLKKRDVGRRPVDMSDLIREGLTLLSHDAEIRHVVVKTKFPATACTVAGDSVLLEPVIVNLITNAMQAMADTPAERREILVTTDVVANHVEVAVRDSGPGLPPSLDGRLFEPFVSTKEHGLGIGLTIVRGIVEAHGGTIHARNAESGGAEFRFTVPITAAYSHRASGVSAANAI